jgi:putative ABC transport system ATP-binding protein
MVVIGMDGRVAEEGTYQELTSKEDGAFNQLMQWQLTGESSFEQPKSQPIPTEEEEIEYDLEKDDEGDEISQTARVTASEPKQQ